MEEPPPFAQMNRSTPSSTEVPHTPLAEERWVDVGLGRLKDVDEIIERRARLRNRRGGAARAVTKSAGVVLEPTDHSNRWVA